MTPDSHEARRWGEHKDGCRTFVISQGEVEVAGHGRCQGEVEAVAAERLVFVHGADGLDHLRRHNRHSEISWSGSTWWC